MFVTFVEHEKLGIHPQSEHTSTPSGIYAYPLKEAYSMMEQKMVRFGGDRKYICIFEGVGNLLDLQKYTETDYDKDVESLMDQWKLLSPDNEEFALNMLVRWQDEMWQYDNRAGMAIWRLVARIAERADRLYSRESMIIANSVFRKLGYDGLVDNGGSIIHIHEPSQALFLSKSACRTVDFIINDHLGGIPPAFPMRGEKKIRGFVNRENNTHNLIT